MIDKASAVGAMSKRLKGLPVGHGLEMRTYKRNRMVLFIRTGEDAYLVHENGYETKTFEASARDLRKVLKTLLKREFPRSNKIRLYNLGEVAPAKYASLPRKTL